MERRTFFKSAGLAAVSLAGLGSGHLFAKPAKKPNIVFFLIDDLGWTDLSCFGSEYYETPHIDALCKRGMKFTDAYAACPVCSPTRASIMSGKYPARLNTTDWFGAPQPYNVQRHWTRNKPLLPAQYKERLPLEEKTMAEAFDENGYNTYFLGKWHLGPEGFWPEDQGFDVNVGGGHSGNPGSYFAPYTKVNDLPAPKGEYLPERLRKEAAELVHKDQKGNPFLLYFSMYSVHTPLQTKQVLKKKYKEKKKNMGISNEWITQSGRRVRGVQEHEVYAGMIEAMDNSVGKVVEALKQEGLYEDTVFVFMSDNGGLSTSEGRPTCNLPLKCGKGWMYEGGIREPMFVVWPGVTKPGSVCDYPVTSTDFYPTLLDIAGLPLQPRQHVDGVSFAPLLKGEKKLDRKAIFWHYPHYGNQGGSPSSAVRCGDYKLIEWFESGKLELFNLKEDIGEKNDLADKMPGKVKELHKMLVDWRKEVDAKMPMPNPRHKG
ncbi:Arylsulfatase [Sedimentisphaera cyanobacteriorum]|uniref:Arylsulfatase n=1 Tax=Sedimentisphaera cyanobacteriorum TaxID=1940790 RepID=A0A1Q2HSZ2_9BACT|nr:sulfatase [Sedimentisphaera cyanobacteriorum]AQQ10393.1 Arylsulfatase [Sedimentisphaera cyanobacteriorum]